MRPGPEKPEKPRIPLHLPCVTGPDDLDRFLPQYVNLEEGDDVEKYLGSNDGADDARALDPDMDPD